MQPVKFGETEFNHQKYEAAKKRVERLGQHYTEEAARIIIKEYLRTTRSPARATAYKEWLETHPEK